jgi:hypothetical protein
VKRCGNCAHWKEVDRFGVGTCDAVKHDVEGGETYDYDSDSAEEIASNNDLAFVVDGSGYYAALKTRENFGCALHTVKEWK